MTFTITKLTGQRAAIRGTDGRGVDGEQVVSTVEWDDIKRRQLAKHAEQEFGATVEEFFAPLLEAAEKANLALEVPEDPFAYIVLQEGEEPTAGSPRHVFHLSYDSMVLRAVEQGEHDRLEWVGGELQVLAKLPDPVDLTTNPWDDIDPGPLNPVTNE